jgi:hypothetical protein
MTEILSVDSKFPGRSRFEVLKKYFAIYFVA